MSQKKIMSVLMAFLIGLSFSNLTGCHSNKDKTQITILAAASLTEVFTALEKDYETAHPDVDLQLSYAGTATLMTQIKEGMEADVFISANTTSMDDLLGEGYIIPEDVTVFAHNDLVLMVSKQSDYTIGNLSDLLQDGVKIVVAESPQPIGKYTEQMLHKITADGLLTEDYANQFLTHVVSQENSVKGITTKVEMGEADAGIVYRTDFTSANQSAVLQVEIPKACNQLATYTLAGLKESKHKDIADQFIQYVLSEKGRDFLQKYGFILP